MIGEVPLKSRIADKAYFVALLGVSATLPFNTISLNSAFIILLVLAWLAQGYFENKFSLAKNNVILISFCIFYLLHVIFLLNTHNTRNGAFELEKKLSLLILPIILLTNQSIKKEDKRTVLVVFALSCLCMVFYSFSQILVYHFGGGKPLYYKNETYDYREYFVQVAERHPTYTSMYLVFSSIIVFNQIKENFFNKLLGGAIIFILVGVVYLLSSRLVILGSLILLSIYSFASYFQKNKRNILFSLSIALIGILISILMVLYVPSIKSRFVGEVFDTYTFAPARGIHYNSLNTRISESICGFDIISEHPIAGVGTGDVQDELNSCYERRGFSPILYEESYNPHNQFVHTFAGLGILGMGALCFLLFHLFKAVDISNNLEYCYVVCIAFLLFFTETFFGFQKGVVFFSLFTSLLYVKKV